jgi:hypothetical protein
MILTLEACFYFSIFCDRMCQMLIKGCFDLLGQASTHTAEQGCYDANVVL